MRVLKILAVITLAVAMPGCVVESMNPLYTEQDVISEPALLGTWEQKRQEEGEVVTLTIEKGRRNGYELVIGSTSPETNAQSQDKYEGHLVSLEGHLYLDVVAEEPRLSPRSFRFDISRSERENDLEPHLFPLGDDAYLEIAPSAQAMSKESEGSSYELRVRVWHHIVRPSFDGDVLRLDLLDPSFLQKLADRGDLNIDHLRSDDDERDGFHLTASTEDLQKFVVRYADDEAFETAFEFHRSK